MQRFIGRLVNRLNVASRSRPAPRANRRAPLDAAAIIEVLETRQLLSAYPISDMTQWAQQFPAPTHTQNLWLNFDGKHNDGQTISAFVAPAGQNTDAAIQDVLYRVQETFSPFNVQVRRETGDGNYSRANGDTTIFIGGNTANVSVTAPGGNYYVKNATSFTPGNNTDYARPASLDHAPNSNPFDLAYVDPMSGAGFVNTVFNPATWTNGWSNSYLVSNITHEAGHTFGLAHVRTDGLQDPAALGTSTLGEIMSYNTQVPQTFFANRTLPVTTFNYQVSSGTTLTPSIQPVSHFDIPFFFGNKIEIPVNITTENTFTYLQTILGKRYSDGYDHVSDPNIIDPSSTNTHAPSSWAVGSGRVAPYSSSMSGVLGNAGDFDVFNVSTAQTRQFHIDVATNDFGLAYPDVMVKDSSGNQLFFNHAATPWSNAHIDFQAAAGQTYSVIVGSEDSSGRGRFTITVSHNEPAPVLTGSTFTFNFPGTTTRLGGLSIQSEDVNTGIFSGVYYDFMGLATRVSGRVSNTATNSSEVTTSDFSFGGSAQFGNMLAMEQFGGKLTGTGWNDTLDGTLVDQVFLLPYMAPIWNWIGSSTAKDF